MNNSLHSRYWVWFFLSKYWFLDANYLLCSGVQDQYSLGHIVFNRCSSDKNQPCAPFTAVFCFEGRLVLSRYLSSLLIAYFFGVGPSYRWALAGLSDGYTTVFTGC